MSMLDGFFNKGFKGAKCKTLLKLTIPRIKLLRNRREIQIKQMRKDIAKLLETGQEATARIRVEHIIREVNMMAAQEIIELFCELIAVRIPIIETQRECPLDLKEAISSVCFAAPRCADLPELQQIQMLFTSKYGKEFVSAATELMPDCGVNRQLIELLSIRAPPAEVKLKLLKEIAEEHELDWDPAASETEFFKSHEDLLNGPSEFVSGSKLALPEEKHEALCSAPVETAYADSKSDSGLDSFDLPEVPKFSVRQNPVSVSAPVFVPPTPPSPSGIEDEPTKLSGRSEDVPHQSYLELDAVMPEQLVASSPTLGDTSVSKREEKQFLPFISPPPLSSTSFPTRQSEPASSFSRTKSDFNVDLQDVLAAAQAAAESAERAAAAARSAASLAQVRITELVNMQNDCATENKECLFHSQSPNEFTTLRTQQFDHQQSFGNTDHSSYSDPPNHGSDCVSEAVNSPSFDMTKVECASPHTDDHNPKHEFTHHQPQHSTSVEDDPYFSYPNLFTAQDSTVGSGNHSSEDASRSTHEH